MFNSTKIGDSVSVSKNSVHKTLNETSNGIPRSFLQPKITSTPLARRDSIFATPPKPHLISPRRYSLSEIATPPRTNRRDVTRLHAIGPLLASTKYNVNISTYEDTKSPGLAGRIVQYNEEAEGEKSYQRPPTHQTKYGSPGLFPVVHLFKKKLPALEQKPRRVTIRIASPEYSRQHTQEYNRKLLEGIIKPNSPNNSRHLFASPSGEGNGASTRSVLEALKEISRKRIHASGEFDLNEDCGKRLRTDNFTDNDSNKRLRDDSPLLDNSSSPSKPGPKRICMYDEYSASISSTNFSVKKSEQPGPKRKSISTSTLTENPKESKQVKLINAETQTLPAEKDDVQAKETTSKEQTDLGTEQTEGDKSVRKKESPVKIFDDAPLERIRKNRLAALMGSLAGKDAVLAPKPNYASGLNSNAQEKEDTTVEMEKTNKPLVSILSSPKKDSPVKSNKHVHFSIPESISEPNLTSPSITSFSITQSSASITSPISSACEAKSVFELNKNEEKLETPAPPSSPVGLTPSSSETTTSIPTLTFNGGSNSSSATSIVSKESSTSLLGASVSKTDTTIPNLQFKFPTSNTTSTPASQIFSSSVTNPPSSISSPPKMGGFKFDLNKPAATSVASTATATITTTVVSSIPTFSFGSTTQTIANKDKPLFGNIVSLPSSTTPQSTAGSTSTGFSFGVKSTNSVRPLVTSVTTATTVPSFFSCSFGKTTSITTSTSTPASVATSMPTFKFGPNTENKTASSGFGLTNSSVAPFGSTSTPSSVSAFGANTSAAANIPATSVVPFGTSKAPIFSFGTPSTTSSSSFGATVTTSAPITFGAPTTTSGGFGATSSGGFGAPVTTMPSSGFGVTTTSSTMGGFGTSTTATSGGFGTSSASPMFGSNKQVSPFGMTTTSATSPFGTSPLTSSSPFSKNSTPALGQITTQSTFGTPMTTVSFGASALGGATTTTPSVFGGASSSASGFGKPSGTTSIFGGATNTQASGFGTTTSKPIFGAAAAASPFGNPAPATTASAFGSTATPTFNFGSKTTASNAFGGGNAFGTTTTAGTGFGTSTTPAFGSTNSFGSGSSSFGSGSAFGTSAAPAFGAVTTTAQSTGFGSSNAAAAFGSPSTGFGTSNKGPVIGSSTTSAFGAAPAPSFGTSAPTAGFGAANNTPGFGTNAAASAFAKPQTGFGPNSNAFGASNSFGTSQLPASGFGATNPPSSQTPVFSFGATTAPKPASVFSFGAPSAGEPLKPTFNFTGGSSAPAFGNTATPSFGNTATPAFGAAGVPQFNAPQPNTTGMFSIGSGSTSGRTRTQLRAKRRT